MAGQPSHVLLTCCCRKFPSGGLTTIIAWESAGVSSCSHGVLLPLNHNLQHLLHPRCWLLFTDEFHSSMLCCGCKATMDGMRVAGEPFMDIHMQPLNVLAYRLSAQVSHVLLEHQVVNGASELSPSALQALL